MAERADNINAVDENGDTALHRAAEHGSVTRIHQLLRQGANLEARNEDGATPLILAVASEEQEAVERLLEAGANLDARDSSGDTPLHYAAGMNSPDLTARLLEGHANPQARNANDATPIHAITERSTHIEPSPSTTRTLDLLLNAGADLNAQDKEGNTALHFLAEGRRAGAAQLTEALLDRGARSDLKNHQGLTSLETTSPEDSAVKRINSRLVREAIQQYQERQQSPEVDNNPVSAFEEHQAHELGAQFDSVSERFAGEHIDHYADDEFDREPPSPSRNAFPDGNTDLHDAAANGHLERTIALLREGANPNLPDEHGNTPLHNAAYVNATEITERLLDAKADPNAVNRDGNTPLHVAIHFSGEGDYDATIRRLLDAGAGLELRNSLDGYTPLHVAVREGFHGTAEELLRRGADPNAQDHEGQTPLHTASRLLASHSANTMLRGGADPNAVDHKGNTPLHVAAYSDSTEVIDRLLESKARVNARNTEDRTPLDLAHESNSREASALLEKAGGVRDDVDSIAKTGLSVPDLEQADRLSDASPLHIVAAAGDHEKVDSLLKHGANPNEFDANHRTPLHEAVDAGSLETVDRLLQAGANPNQQDAYLGHSALHRAVEAQSHPIAERLLKSGADPNLRDGEGDTPLHSALKDTLHKDKQLAVIDTLLAHGANSDLPDRLAKSTPLHLAVERNNLQASQRLIEERADPNARDRAGYTPLYLAARQSSAMTQQLLVSGASPHISNSEGHTPLHAAALSGRSDSAEHLLNAGADPNSRTEHQQTPMHFAAHSKSPETVDRLAAAGGDPNARDENGSTPLHCAALADSIKTIDRLLEAGADPTIRSESDLQTPRELAHKHDFVETAWRLGSAERARQGHAPRRSTMFRIQRFINRFRPYEKDVPDEVAHGLKETEDSAAMSPKIIELRMKEYYQQNPHLKQTIPGESKSPGGESAARKPSADQRPDKAHSTDESHTKQQHRKEKTMPEPHWTHSKSARQFTEQVAERVAKQVEKGEAPFQKGYDKPNPENLQPFNPATLKRFKGINAVQLQSVAQEKGYNDPRWMSFRTANRIGAKIRKGEKGTRVEYLRFPPKPQDKQDKDAPAAGANGKEKEQPQITHGTYVVFNAEQIERMPPLEQQLAKEPQQHEICERAERMIENAGVKIEQPENGASHSYYDKQKDAIVMPDMEKFKSPEAYYGQAVKEMTNRETVQRQQNRSEPQGEAQQHSSSARRDMRSEMACRTVSAKLHLPAEPTGERHKAQWAQTIRSSPNELRYAARDADRIADKVLEHDRPQQRQQSEPSREAVAAPATPERMQEAQRQLQQPQQEMAAMSR